MQCAGVAVAEKKTGRGAAPEEGAAEAVHTKVQGGFTVTVPVLEQGTPSARTVIVHVKVPAPLYVCEGFCSPEEVPSPKVHAKEGEPLQWAGAAEAEKKTARGATPDEGVAEAVQVTVQGAVTEADPSLVQVIPPTSAVIIQW